MIKIISRAKYLQLITELKNLRKEREELLKVIDLYRKCNRKLEHDIVILKRINSPIDVIFPNTEEGGLGDTDTPDNLSDIWSL